METEKLQRLTIEKLQTQAFMLEERVALLEKMNSEKDEKIIQLSEETTRLKIEVEKEQALSDAKVEIAKKNGLIRTLKYVGIAFLIGVGVGAALR